MDIAPRTSRESRQYLDLNPAASAIAAGVTSIILFLLIRLPTMGFGGMMGGYGGGWMMGGYRGGYGFGLGIVWIFWIFGALVAALAGALVAWIYNAVNTTQRKKAGRAEQEGGVQLPGQP